MIVHGIGKICNFQPLSRRVPETVQNRTKVTIEVAYTLSIGAKINDLQDDLERPLRSLLHKTCVFWSPPRKFE